MFTEGEDFVILIEVMLDDLPLGGLGSPLSALVQSISLDDGKYSGGGRHKIGRGAPAPPPPPPTLLQYMHVIH